MNTTLTVPELALKPFYAPVLMSEDEDEGGSVADKGLAMPKKEKDEEKAIDPGEILEEGAAGLPLVQEKAKTDLEEEKRMEKTL